MKDKAKVIFGNVIPDKIYKKACKAKKKNMKKYGDDTDKSYEVKIIDNPYIGKSLGVSDIRVAEGKGNEDFDMEKGIIVGNIRMGFGHYRISMAMASCAQHLGYKPYWFDLNSFPQTTCTKLISGQNELYSLGSRLSKNPVFNKLVWEPVNYELFRKLSYNCADQKNAEIMAPVYKNIPKDIPVIATHVWPAQAAIHAGMKYVVNAIPDNWPMALHLSEGSIHTIQTHMSYHGYRVLNGMNGKKVCNSMNGNDLVYTGHYIDYELVDGIEKDCGQRIDRKKNGKPMRFLLTIGGAGAQKELFAGIIRHLIPEIRNKRAVLYVNVGDYKNVWDELCSEIEGMKELAASHMDNWEDSTEFARKALDPSYEINGIHGFWHKNIFEAVYITNLLMRSCDVLVTKPSELSFYPVPKLFIRRVGKHEMWGAIHSAEIGDGTLECRDLPHINQMIDLFMEDDNYLIDMCENIKRNKSIGIYDGALNVVKIAMNMKEKKLN
ncbi:DUF6937 domain-containing protein [Butyrivibrio sp. NC3005]|uniref:DUF6937 domain-containing protein n=1 Tax=Butyrivibrio sp. NC3005 TaxID=1280685 RepID=UPI000413AFCE|nr:hypothetical protein [Butyrivibrio sp. NC3005]